jgi:transposase-like protein
MAVGEVDMSNKRYTKESKIEAVRQVVERGHSVAEVARDVANKTGAALIAAIQHDEKCLCIS